MNREQMIERLASESFDVLVIGGGASGLGVAVDAASRGYRTALLEAHDFAKATSSRSTKLIHGGVRYLEQMNFKLVREALHERGRLFHNAPHLVSKLAFVIPRYKWWERPFYGLGMKLYDKLAGRLNLEKSKILNRDETIAAVPNVQRDGLRGGVMYYDGQFDDARMAIVLARTAESHGAAVANYVRVTGLIKEHNRVTGVEAEDALSREQFHVSAKVVVNATGIFSDVVRKLDDPAAVELIEPAQGVHLVLDRSFLASDHAIMVPHTDDGRVLFVIPWHGRVLVGTTDTLTDQPRLEPRALPDEAEFILRNANRYLENDPTPDDVLSIFAGQRPLVHRSGKTRKSKSISRSHEIFVSPSGLVSLTGGKWTTYRKMAEDTVARAISVGGLPFKPCATEQLRLHGYMARESPDLPPEEHLRGYGADAAKIARLTADQPQLAAQLHNRLPYTAAEIVWAVRHESARKLEDGLARRTRALILDARASIEAAPGVAQLMAQEIGRDVSWIDAEVRQFEELARGYLLAES